MKMQMKKSNAARRAWNILRLTLLWARKGGVLRRRLMLNFPRYIKNLRHNHGGNTYRYGDERQLSFDDTPVIHVRMHRPSSLRFKLPNIPCINPAQVDFDFDFNDTNDDGLYYDDIARKSFLRSAENEQDEEEEKYAGLDEEQTANIDTNKNNQINPKKILTSILMDLNPTAGENYAHPEICFFHVIFKASALAFYILSALFFDSFVIIFVVTVLLAALDFWVVKNVSGRILVGLRWWNEINDEGESIWKFECLDQESLSRMNKKDSWLFWWTLYLTAVLWLILGIFSLIRFQADYVLVVGVCLTLSVANIVGFTKCRKDARNQIQAFASQTIASRFSSQIQSAFTVV